MEGQGALLTERRHSNLVSAVLEGDDAAFDLLVRQYSNQVFRVALRMLGNREDAEDVQQETFLRAYRGLRRFRGGASFGTWVYSIAARLCLDRRRQRTRRAGDNAEDIPVGGSLPEDSPEDRLLSLEAAARVQKALAGMSPPDRLLIVLKFVEELSHEEIARILGCSVESSRSRLARAKKLFRERYERIG